MRALTSRFALAAAAALVTGTVLPAFAQGIASSPVAAKPKTSDKLPEKKEGALSNSQTRVGNKATPPNSTVAPRQRADAPDSPNAHAPGESDEVDPQNGE